MKDKKGFTLLELLIVIGIIAVLGGVMLAQFSGSTDSALAATCMNNMRTLRVSKHPDQNTMKTVLVAEDEESNYELVRIVLQKRYNLLRAHNGIEAVTMFEEDKPDLILMDIRMPEMDGLDATRIIKEVNQDVPIIALSAFAEHSRG